MHRFWVLTILLSLIVGGCSENEDDESSAQDSGHSTAMGDAGGDSGSSKDSSAERSIKDGEDGSNDSSSNQEKLASLYGQIRDCAKLDSCASDDDCVQVSYGCDFIVYTPRVTDEKKLLTLISEYNALYWEGREDEYCPASGVWNYRCIEAECTDVGSNW
ncbi:MAG: hypothetical protein JXA30_11665 [Deltaproteobacteria bacterium]|nr:hypothetical protein [Deltaproteobacteria bacterium]